MVEGENPEIYRDSGSNEGGVRPNGPVEAKDGTILAQARRTQKAEADEAVGGSERPTSFLDLGGSDEAWGAGKLGGVDKRDGAKMTRGERERIQKEVADRWVMCQWKKKLMLKGQDRIKGSRRG